MRDRYSDVGNATCLLGVFETEGVTELMHRRDKIIVSERGLRIIILRTEPNIAALNAIGRIVCVRRRISRGGLANLDIGGTRSRILNRQVGVA